MKIHPATLCFILWIPIALLSWIFDIYSVSLCNTTDGEPLLVKSLLSAEGIRWILRTIQINFVTYPPLAEGVICAFGCGLFVNSGIGNICFNKLIANFSRDKRKNIRLLSRKEFTALLSAIVVMLLIIIVLICLIAFAQHSLLNVEGGFRYSPLHKGTLFLISLTLGIMGVVYGSISGNLHTNIDLVKSIVYYKNFLCHHLIVCFVASFLFSSLEYTQIMISIPFFIIYLPLLLTIGYCYLETNKKQQFINQYT